jgi:hypothetical protein
MRRLEFVIAAVFAALSALVVLGAGRLAYWTMAMPGPGFAPWWIGIAGLGLSACLVAAALRTPAAARAAWPDLRGLRDVGATYALVWLALAATPLVGFTVAAVAMTLAFLVGVMGRGWPGALVAAAVIAVLLKGVFSTWLGLPLPRGLLGF